MAYSPRPFDYSLRSHDSTDMTPEGADIFDVRDTQLENYLRTETGLIKAETDTINTNITNLTNTVDGFVSAPGDWDFYNPTLYRGSEVVTTSTVRSAYTFSEYLCFVSFEILVTDTSSWPGGEVVSITLPIGADTTTRQLGIGVYNNRAVLRTGMAFIESTTGTGYTTVLALDGFNIWAGTNPNIEGNRNNDRWYFNLTYRPA